jgi:hypothetical protein
VAASGLFMQCDARALGVLRSLQVGLPGSLQVYVSHTPLEGRQSHSYDSAIALHISNGRGIKDRQHDTCMVDLYHFHQSETQVPLRASQGAKAQGCCCHGFHELEGTSLKSDHHLEFFDVVLTEDKHCP